jgi:hypothetical protein
VADARMAKGFSPEGHQGCHLVLGLDISFYVLAFLAFVFIYEESD